MTIIDFPSIGKFVYNQAMEKLLNDIDKQFALLGEEIIRCINKYREDCNVLHEKIEKKQGALESFSQNLFLSKSPFFQDDIHEEYYKKLNKYSEDIKGMIVKVDNQELKNNIVDSLFTDLCKPANKVEQKFIRINYDADDYIFHELISYLTDSKIKDLYINFINRKTSDLLPNQKKLVKELKTELIKRNIEVPKKKFRLF